MYDLIGDIHGHADELVRLLGKLGYNRRQGIYRHPQRTAVFVGDLIDRGPKIREVLRIVRDMVEDGAARTVMGNHEFNAIAYQTERRDSPGTFLRRHNDKNTIQHIQTLKQLETSELSDYIDWFRTLPPWIDLGGLRVVHAAWSPRTMQVVAAGLKDHGTFSEALMQEACTRGNDLFHAIENVLKGIEVDLPPGVVFRDKDGHVRCKTRVKWYTAAQQQTYRSYAFPSDPSFPDVSLPQSLVQQAEPYSEDEVPVFFGHYWLSDPRPGILASNVACLDYSVAQGGFLCAYRWTANAELSNGHFVTSQ